MPRSIDKVKRVWLAVKHVIHLDCMTFDCDATLTLEIHIVKHLRLEVFTVYSFGKFK